MKRTLLLVFLGMLGAAPAFAQSAPSTSTATAAQAQAPEPGARLDRVASKLGLDEAGTARLRATFEKYRAQLSPIRQDAMQARQALESELAASQPDEARVSALTDRLASDRGKMRAIGEQRANELRTQLTPTQYAKLVLHRHHRFGRGGHGHMRQPQQAQPAQ